VEASFYPTLHGDILSRANLYRWIREFFRASGMAPGYYMEFGVLNGEATIEAYRQLRGHITQFFGFDSFAGLPELSSEDRAAAPLMPNFSTGNFSSMSKDQVHATILAQSGMPPELLTLQLGYFSESLPRFDRGLLANKGECRVCYIDCDLHSSSQQVFEFLDPLVTTGTWILLDDYWCYRGDPRQGQRRAFDEWIASSKRVGVSEYGNFKGWGKAYLAYVK
jgi:hypothetical protein